MRDATPSPGRRRGAALDGGSTSSRPLVKMPGGCRRRNTRAGYFVVFKPARANVVKLSRHKLNNDGNKS